MSDDPIRAITQIHDEADDAFVDLLYETLQQSEYIEVERDSAFDHDRLLIREVNRDE